MKKIEPLVTDGYTVQLTFRVIRETINELIEAVNELTEIYKRHTKTINLHGEHLKELIEEQRRGEA